MSGLQFEALPTETVRAYQDGGLDANDHRPERHISDGPGHPCRHCLTNVPDGEPYLILAHRPFPTAQPYAEVGPIFVHAAACPRYDRVDQVPPMVSGKDRILMRGYGHDDRIVYGTGQVIATDALVTAAAELFERPEIAYIHLRSAANNCYQCRIDRG